MNEPIGTNDLQTVSHRRQEDPRGPSGMSSRTGGDRAFIIGDLGSAGMCHDVSPLQLPKKRKNTGDPTTCQET